MLKRISSFFYDSLATVYPDLGLFILRVSTGIMMAYGHGLGKWLTYSQSASGFPDPLGVGSPISMALAVFAEFFCSIALVLGAGTRLILIPLIITMTVAVFIVHGADPFAKKEMALLYLFPYITLMLAGPGKFSLDNWIAIKFK